MDLYVLQELEIIIVLLKAHLIVVLPINILPVCNNKHVIYIPSACNKLVSTTKN